MKTVIFTIIAVCFFGCVSAEREDGMDGNRNAETNSEGNHSQRMVIYDFSKGSDLRGWEVEDDVVMGGRSKGSFSINREGNALFSGTVSLENNGGFSSVQYNFDPIDVSKYSTAAIRVKGDGKRYQFIAASAKDDRHHYVYEFQAGNDWRTAVVPLAEMYPVYRGERLDRPNYPGETMSQVRFLIATKKPESFSLEIDKIWLE